MTFAFGDIIDAVSHVVPPTNPAFIHGDRTIAWAEATKRMNNLARNLHAKGAQPRDKVAFYMRNGIEYGELSGACFLGSLTHVNVNYRYKPEEVRYIVDNSDATVVVYAREFRDTVAQIHNQLDKVKLFVEISDTPDVAAFATQYEKLATTGNGEPPTHTRSPDDELFIYTGGTTGMPKGVIYRHGDLATALLGRIALATGVIPTTLKEITDFVIAAGENNSRYMPTCPQMHGTGFFGTITTTMNGGTVVTVDNASLDPHAIWRSVEANGVTSMAIVGDPFARPLLQALDEKPGEYKTDSVVAISSSGAMWSAEIKQGLLNHLPQATLTDSFASTEALGMGASVTQKGMEAKTAAFMIGPNALVIDDNDQPVVPGSGQSGRLAVAGLVPLGYYKDEEKTSRLFKTINGVRFSVPGDYAIVEADGRITVLGRGSNCINTAGEKVYPEEVEETLKRHPSIEDCLVVGMPDEKWGSAVTGVVVLANGAKFDEEALRLHVRESLAGYKTPKRILIAGVNLRAPNGKADYKSATDFAKRELGLT
ncbi:MAG TPA: acyl-CoA synthetase [Rhizomicrobium sp.]|jgi:fatty-acyl-CoA synthase|nr:acyl-CoA synthetase [Rhizomicrobium sp.]